MNEVGKKFFMVIMAVLIAMTFIGCKQPTDGGDDKVVAEQYRGSFSSDGIYFFIFTEDSWYAGSSDISDTTVTQFVFNIYTIDNLLYITTETGDDKIGEFLDENTYKHTSNSPYIEILYRME